MTLQHIDWIDSNGNITEHILRADGRTVCGRKPTVTQEPLGNKHCKRCFRWASLYDPLLARATDPARD